jgi:hypothetical protein
MMKERMSMDKMISAMFRSQWPDEIVIGKRLRQRLSLAELGALTILVVFLIWIAFIKWGELPTALDLNVILACGQGNCDNYYYGYWFLPFIRLFNTFPDNLAFFLWGLLNILGAWFAIRVFGGVAFFALVSYQMLFVLWWGQTDGMIAGGVALTWYGLSKRKWWWAGVGLCIAFIKYQIGILALIPILMSIRLSFKEWIKVAIIPLIVIGISLVIYPGWILDVINRILQHPPYMGTSLSLWRYFGWFALILFLPLFFLPRKPMLQSIVWMAAGSVALPYFQHHDLLQLMVMPIGWTALLGNIGFGYYFIAEEITRWVIVLPLTIYISIIGYFIVQKLHRST